MKKAKKILGIFLSLILTITSSITVFGADTDVLTYDEFMSTLKSAYSEYGMELRFPDKTTNQIFTKEQLEDELQKIPQKAKDFENVEIKFKVIEEDTDRTSISPRIMPVDRTVSVSGMAYCPALVGAFAEIRMDVYTTVDINLDKFIAVNGHSSYQIGPAVNFNSYEETGFDWGYSNSQKTLNISWSGRITFANGGPIGSTIVYTQNVNFNGSVNA